MDFRHQLSSAGALSGLSADALVVVTHGDAIDPSLDAAVASLVKEAVAAGDLQLKGGRTLLLHRPADVKAPRLVISVAANASVKAFKTALANALAQVKGLGAKHVAVALGHAGEVTEQHAEALVTAAHDATYVYRHTKPSASAAPKLTRATLLCARGDEAAVARGLQRGAAIAAGATLAREVANRPGNHCTPTQLAEHAEALARDVKLKVEVLGRKEIEKLGMGAFLAVAQGSDEPPRFIVLRYNGAAADAAPVVLVGKGITFDTGGISIKPAAEMDEMKFDMGGAASVLGTFRAVAQLKARINLVGLIPTCENMPGGRAVKPGDVVTSLSGKTVEILNTDAEGRLVLCDALTYSERFKPQAVIDIATLTGACVVALGAHTSGLLGNNDELIGQLLSAGQSADDRAWQLPLFDEYQEQLDSPFADIANIGGPKAGTITAACFLSRFTKNLNWAHLDIAGTAWTSGGKDKGATGRPVPLLTQYLLDRAKA
jgi:leucyl aminopeptidase